MQTSDFDYHLPQELIAQQPAAERTAARLMLVDRKTGKISHYRVSDLPSLLQPADLVVLNDTRVIPARVFGKKQKTGGRVEVLFIAEGGNFSKVGREPPAPPNHGGNGGAGTRAPYLSDTERLLPNLWEAFLHAGGRSQIGDVLLLANGKINAVVRSIGEFGRVMLEIACDGDFSKILEQEGLPPLPPYIKRLKDELATDVGRCQRKQDYERYQTVYAKIPGAIAAPTAGLHFSETLLARLREKGVQTATVTLHVGPGTFIPVKSEKVEDHKMEPERYIIEEAAAKTINDAISGKRRIIAVGTTVVRALESAANSALYNDLRPPRCHSERSEESRLQSSEWRNSIRCAQDDKDIIRAGTGSTNIFIHPPYRFKVINALLTNFHLPRSTLLMLVSAFAGRELIRAAYDMAIGEKYRFYSYGDCMLIL